MWGEKRQEGRISRQCEVSEKGRADRSLSPSMPNILPGAALGRGHIG